mmetsp:Transcript_13036/g.39732  ORF Transcript_13036/g.39732 Transcript_13036/m.39732 type:complete len:101 (+) Transcript_13036:1115-1417(+)
MVMLVGSAQGSIGVMEVDMPSVVLGSFAIGARSHEPEAVWADAAAVAGIVVMDFTTGPCRRLFAFGGVATPPPGARGARLRHIIEDRDATGKMREYMRDS